MADVFSVAKRSKVMSAIKARGNKDTELKLKAIFKAAKVKGWLRHRRIAVKLSDSRRLTVRPDFVFSADRVAVFVDGCFWHVCPRHFNMPANNTWGWERKFSANYFRDRSVNRALRASGWTIVRIWEHDLAHEARVINRITRAIKLSQSK
jgi:DNA mismatch endonuclease (patch repair protein)